MLIHIVTEAKEKNKAPLFSRLFKRITTEELRVSSNPFDALVHVLPYSEKQLEQMDTRRLLRLVKKVCLKLERHNANRIVASKPLKAIFLNKQINFKNIDDEQVRRTFFKLVPEGIRRTARMCNINLLDAAICISDTKMDRISEYLIRELCYDIKKLTLCTNNTAAARAFCEDFFEETGFSVSVCATPVRSPDILIDVDDYNVCVGKDLFFADFDLGYDFNGYRISHADAAACIKTVDVSQLKCIYEYSKKG
ncbi:MAG: hypothetical protein IKW64_04345 [Clostridia bacterium]|nr:hypothetical protein [Clostridia bacterium]